jgi:uncharacterized protein YgbK (DUF1537 family)
MRFAVIADDDTGATDAAGMLTARGVRTVLVLDVRRPPDARRLAGFDAIVVGTQARSVAPREAGRRTSEAIAFARRFQPRLLQIKYCSTFDSTPRGNIGPSLDAALDATGAAMSIVSPALPVNGRTTYMGHHFVGRELLSESPLRHHPLNPMTDSNLARWLQRQTRRRVALIDLTEIRRGPAAVRRRLDALRREGAAYVVTDAIAPRDLRTTLEAARDHRVVSGGSGLTAEAPRLLFPGRQRLSFAARLKALRPGLAVISGSRSPATERQRAAALGAGFAEIAVVPAGVWSGRFDAAAALGRARAALARGRPVLVHARAGGRRPAGWSEARAGLAIGRALSAIAAGLARGPGGVGRLVVAGGETSGAVCRRLGFGALEIGRPIDPGVPYAFPLDDPGLLVVLKSGNFGSDDLYNKVRRLRR